MRITRLRTTSRPGSKSRPIAGREVGELIAAIGSDAIAPGSGPAAAVALALAAGCAAKACAVTLKHHPKALLLAGTHKNLIRIWRAALAGADRDAELFERMSASEKPAATELLRVGDEFQQLAVELLELIDAIEPKIGNELTGDLAAARLLADAARHIQVRNTLENRSSVRA
jgi:hypothetical protein